MILRLLGAAILGVSVAALPAERVRADAGDAIVGGVIGGIIGGAIVNERNKKRQSRTVVRRTYRAPVNTYARQQNREVQVALNYFGFPAGTPDGVVGRNTRNAMSNYQAHMGYPVTGQLTEYERSFLVSSYHRAQSGGALTHTQMAQSGGPRGLLILYRNEAAGGGVVQPQQPVQAAAPATVPVQQAPVQAAAPEPEPAQQGLPKFGVVQASGPSMASHCNQVSLITNSNGGFTNASSVTDADFALSEQFCLARTYAIADGEQLAGQIQGITTAQLDQQCAGLAPAMAGEIASVSIKPQAAVVQEASGFVVNSGQSPAELMSTARICLSSGYRTDRADVAMASALLLVATGQPAYGELVAHHLKNGFGVSQRPDLAGAWYGTAIDALDGGAVPVFAPGQPERVEVLRVATGGNSTSAAVIPAFNVPTNN